MNERRIDAFFYGLFMDSEVLLKSQVTAVNPRRGYVEGYRLRIGQRATLLPSSGERSYGMIFSLTHDELERLYAPAGLECYRPEALLSYALDGAGEAVPALCYNLIEAPKPDEANADYAALLREALNKLDFPAEYIASVS